MTLSEYEDASAALLALARGIEDSKRPSYTCGSSDVLENFKRDAKMTGILPSQNLVGHMLKQAAAVARWSQDPLKPQSEPIAQRLADIVNYAKLCYGLVVDLAGASPAEQQAPLVGGPSGDTNNKE